MHLSTWETPRSGLFDLPLVSSVSLPLSSFPPVSEKAQASPLRKKEQRKSSLLAFPTSKPNFLKKLSMLSELTLGLYFLASQSLTLRSDFSSSAPTPLRLRLPSVSLLIKPSDHFWPYLTSPLAASITASSAPLSSSTTSLFQADTRGPPSKNWGHLEDVMYKQIQQNPDEGGLEGRRSDGSPGEGHRGMEYSLPALEGTNQNLTPGL